MEGKDRFPRAPQAKNLNRSVKFENKATKDYTNHQHGESTSLSFSVIGTLQLLSIRRLYHQLVEEALSMRLNRVTVRDITKSQH